MKFSIDGAIAFFNKALEQNPDDFQAHLYLGAIRYVQRDLVESRKQLEIALKLQPDSFVGRYELALLELREGKLDAALKDLEAAERAVPGWLPPHVELTVLYFRLKRPEDGVREKKIVDQLRDLERKQKNELIVNAPKLPSQ